jgi:hypothetical protein
VASPARPFDRAAALPGNALSLDLFDRNNAVAPTGRWCATDWRRSRS